MATKKWMVDPAHSEIQFKVKHLMITTVTGSFTNYDLQVETEEDDFQTAKILFTTDLESITTGNTDRDAHLKSPDFFDAANHPKITFTGTKIQRIDDENYELSGDLSIRGTTKNIKLNVEFGGVVIDPYNNRKAGFTVNGKISRKEFGLTWNAVTEAGGVVVGDEVRIVCEVQLVEQK